MKAVTPEQMKKIDSLTINKTGIPGIVLMENAAYKVVNEVVKDIEAVEGKRILIFAGKGNNGGDAFAVARHLHNMGAIVCVYVLFKRNGISFDSEINYRIIGNMGVEIIELHEGIDIGALEAVIGTANYIVDGIFGSGLKGEVIGHIATIINMINSSGKRVLAIDIPSGICGVTGQVLGTGIKARKTVTFGLPKLGVLLQPGCDFAGELVIEDIGIPQMIINEMEISTNATTHSDAAEFLPKRIEDSNKGDYGKVLIISGSRGMTGAGCLAAISCLRSGAGLVYLGVPASLSHIYDSAIFEAITIPLEDEGKGYLAKGSFKQIEERLSKIDCLAMGPGLSTEKEVFQAFKEIIGKCRVPIVLDADALNLISRDVSMFDDLHCDTVITPHPGEMARLTGKSIEEIQRDRISAAREFSEKHNVITVLKGSRTIIAAPDGRIYINTTGNSGMATAGAGDVLTGIIAGFIGQGTKAFEAAITGVYIHGLAGDEVSKIIGKHGLIASDLAEQLPHTIMKHVTGKK
jgi:NAD(P)H-hydrate epimerase